MDKTLKSHITISSTDSNNSTFNNFMKNNNDKKKSFINDNLENDLKKLILISLKNKKYLEKNDYFFSNTNNNKKNIKKIKLKLTPFQEYEKNKDLFMKRQLSNRELNSSQFTAPWPKIKINDLLTVKNYHHLKKSKSDLNQCLCNYNNKHLNNNYNKKNKTKFFISSLDNDKINNIFNSNESNQIKRNIKIDDSNENNYIKEIRDKLCQSDNAYKTINNNNNIKNAKKRKLPKINKYKRYLGSKTPSFGSLKLNDIKTKYRNIFGIKGENKKFQIPLIYLNKFQFLNEIIQNCK